jgi:hypothetical protein
MVIRITLSPSEQVLFSGLSRRVLERGNFNSVASLKKKRENCIAFYNKTAMPMKWKCKGIDTQKNEENLREGVVVFTALTISRCLR